MASRKKSVVTITLTGAGVALEMGDWRSFLYCKQWTVAQCHTLMSNVIDLDKTVVFYPGKGRKAIKPNMLACLRIIAQDETLLNELVEACEGQAKQAVKPQRKATKSRRIITAAPASRRTYNELAIQVAETNARLDAIIASLS